MPQIKDKQNKDNNMEKQRSLIRQIISGELKKDKSRYEENQTNLGSSTLQREDDSEYHKEIDSEIVRKFRTFSKWDLRKSLPISHHKRLPHKNQKSQEQLTARNQSFKLNLSMLASKTSSPESKASKSVQNNKSNKNRPATLRLQKIVKKTDEIQTTPITRNLSPLPPTFMNSGEDHPDNKKQMHLSAQQEAVHSDRRQRFKKLQNPMAFIKHYMQNQNYKPQPQQKQLLQRLIKIQKLLEDQTCRLDTILNKLYSVMNLAVDYNQFLFLSLLILLAADISLYMRDLSRAFYFYNQTRIAGSYAHLDKLKISAFIGIGKIAFEIKQYESASRVFKKALQYAWRSKQTDIELEIYDWLGQTLHYQGKVRESHYYHSRYVNSENERESSALRKISDDILKEYDKYIYSLQDANLNSLFIEYLSLPIGGDIDTKRAVDKKFSNYKEGESPRMKKKSKVFTELDFPDAKKQLLQFLREDYEFISEIENPDSQKNELVIRKFGKPRHEIDFQHSFQFNKIVGIKRDTFHLSKILKLPLDKQVENMMKDRLQPNWWEKMVEEAKKNRFQKVGALKERVRNSHLSYHKYPSERRRSELWSYDQMNQSFNRTLLDWIDPPPNLSPRNRPSN